VNTTQLHSQTLHNVEKHHMFPACDLRTEHWGQSYIIELSEKSPSLLPSLSPPIPSLSGISKVRNLSMKCWNSAFNAQGSRVIIVVVRVGAVRIYVAAVEALTKTKERQDETQFKTRPKLVEKLVWVPVTSFRKVFIPSYTFDALLSQNWPFLPPNRITLRITLMKGLHYISCAIS